MCWECKMKKKLLFVGGIVTTSMIVSHMKVRNDVPLKLVPLVEKTEEIGSSINVEKEKIEVSLVEQEKVKTEKIEKTEKSVKSIKEYSKKKENELAKVEIEDNRYIVFNNLELNLEEEVENISLNKKNDKNIENYKIENNEIELIQDKNELKDEAVSEEQEIVIENKDSEIKEIYLEDIVFNNLVKMKREIKKLEEEYEGRLFSMDLLKEIVEKANNVYLNNGYITTRVKIKVPQNLEDGKLELEILNGYIENIKLNENRFRDKTAVLTAFPFMKNKMLKLSDIEQGIKQMNALQSNDAKMKILPGEEYGKSIVEITNIPKKRFELVVGYDNMGQENTGRDRGKANIYFDNLFGINDALSFNYQDTLNDDRDKKYSKSYGGEVSIPFGYYTFSYNLSFSEYLNTVAGSSSTFKSSGETETSTYALKRDLYSNRKGSLSLKGTLMLKDDKNYIEDVKLDRSSKKLSVFRFGIDRVWNIRQGYIFSNFTYNKGLDKFGAIENAMAQFEKYNFMVNSTKYFYIGEKQFSYNIKLNGQYTDDMLYGSEKLSLGDLYSVRGFKDDSISGEQGISLSNTLTYKFKSESFIINNSSIYTGLDFGLTKDLSYEEGSEYDEIEKIGGISIGYQYSCSNLTMDLVMAKSLFQPDYFKENDYELYLNVSLIY